jgi:uncharacterized protein
VIPIEESLIYVRPLYLRAQAGRIPELTRVIVAYQNRIVMEPTLDQAIARLFGQSQAAPQAPVSGGATSTAASTTATPSAPVNQTWERLSTEARETYQRAIDAQRAGDWSKYGEEIKRLGDILERMRQQK